MADLNLLVELCDVSMSVQDYKRVAATDAEITGRVMLKPDAESPEQPMINARVRLSRVTDGQPAWQGQSDMQGNYHATRLERDTVYVPVAIDLTGQYECVAAGPVIAKVPNG